MYKIKPRYSDIMDFDLPKSKKKLKFNPKSLVFFIASIMCLVGIANISTYGYLNKDELLSKYTNENKATIVDNSLTPEVKGIETCSNEQQSDLIKSFYWWDQSFKYNKKIIVEKLQGFDPNKAVEFEIDHKSLFDLQKSSLDAKDLVVVSSFNDQFEKADYSIVNANSNNTKVSFNYVEGREFFLYYGGNSTDSNQNSVNESNPRSAFQVILNEETKYPIEIQLNRKWSLKNYDKNPIELTVLVDNNLKIELPAINYEVIGTNVGSALFEEDSNLKSIIPVDELAAGEYFVQASISDDCVSLKSPKLPFTVSYPIFVSWTMDWEGYSTNASNLNQISNLAETYNVPITQFFNPRIYITSSIPQDNKTTMTNWVKERESKGDEVGLHLHMWRDMINTAGVTPRNSPQWDVMTNGYDVLFSAYTFEESDKIVSWAKSRLEEEGFTNIRSFRAGGWEIDSENFQALEKNGIRVDSSGRTFHRLGTQLVPSSWDLKVDTRPYRPSKENLNVSGTNYYNVWEFPNNGADSYIYTYEQLLDRFQQNYSGGIMIEPQVVTYLSHPHWFATDYPKLEKLFEYLKQYRFEDDNGPLVYTTLDDARVYWEGLSD